MMPLSMPTAGETVTIRKITGKDEIRQHLAELGFATCARCGGCHGHTNVEAHK